MRPLRHSHTHTQCIINDTKNNTTQTIKLNIEHMDTFFCLCTQFMLAMRFFRLLGIWLIAVDLAIDLHLPRVWSMECLVDTHMHKRETNWPPNRTVVKRGRTTSIILFCVSWCVWRVCEFYVFILFSAKWIDSNTMEMNPIGFWTLPMVCSPLFVVVVVVYLFSNIQRVAVASGCASCNKMSCSTNVKIEPMNIYEPCMRPCSRE